MEANFDCPYTKKNIQRQKPSNQAPLTERLPEEAKLGYSLYNARRERCLSGPLTNRTFGNREVSLIITTSASRIVRR